MTKKTSSPERNPIKNAEEWVTGGEPMTGPQESYLHTLAREAGESLPEEMTKAEASEQIEKLQEKTGRGVGKKSSPSPKAARRKKG